MKQIKILAITGIRSEYYILLPILEHLHQDNRFDLKLVVSGAHVSDWHGNTLVEIEKSGFNIADKIDNLFMTNRKTQRAKGVGMLIYALSQTVEREKPDVVMYIGDREEGLAASTVCNYMDVLFFHLSGGDPVYGNSDDPVRFAISKLAHIHGAFTQVYADNLLKIGEESFRVFNTGNPALDNIKNAPHLSIKQLNDYLNLGGILKSKRFMTLIKHPLSSEKEDAGQQMHTTLASLEKFCSTHDIHVIGTYPNTDPGAYDILNAIEQYKNSKYIHFYKTLPKDIFINLMRNSLALVGNSSMGIVEAPFYKLPVVNIGNRQQGRLNAGNVVFVPYNEEIIINSLENACFNESYRKKIQQLVNPYGDGDTVDKIIDILLSIDFKEKSWYVKNKLC